MVKSAFILWKFDRLLLAIYLLALLAVLLFPISGPGYRLLSIGADKWMHAVLFGGLAVFLRWNIRANTHAVFMAIGAAMIVAGATEVAQGLVAYRSADFRDLLAGLIGAVIGAVCTNRIMAFAVPEKPFGLLVAVLGLLLGSFFVLADVIGVGKSSIFGTLQVAGTTLGALITLGGIGVYSRGRRAESRFS